MDSAIPSTESDENVCQASPSQQSVRNPEVLFEGHGCKVEKHDGVVVKFGRRVPETECDALKLLEPLQLPIPQVLGFEYLTKDEGRLQMTYIEGDPLDKVWPTLSSPQKKDIAHQLRQILVAIRSLKPDSTTIGSCNNGPVRDCRRISEYVGGPFADEQSFNEFVFDLVRTTPTGIRNAFKKRLRTDHRVVFSHGDLCQHNMIVKDNQIRGLLDWEYSGWYPEYWEYIKFFERYSDNKDWREYAADIFVDAYDDELVDFQAISRWQLP